MPKKLMFVLILFLYITIFYFPQNTNAATGDLKINNDVIEKNDKDKENGTNIIYDVMPDIFLNDRNKREKVQNSDSQKEIKQVEKDIFKGKSKIDKKKYQKIVGQQIAFKKSQNEITSKKETSSSSIPTWLKWVLSSVVVIVAAVIGILLGKRYSKIFKKV
ncbi:hypothetical protein [Companilactobacillus sp. DQM5]|uniref:hypothetical protein n=1 Tax=Companilactobacillus sp. DQM5 TaxID=3463359 RepID=UPI0040598F35